MKRDRDALLQALDDAPGPVHFFIRDDDAGWDDSRLHALLDVTAAVGVPIDLAVIPAALHPQLARDLLHRMDRQPLAVHQHGWSHHNHEGTGRKGEFGNSRPSQDRLIDLRQGRESLLQAFGDRLDPIFTPPWNRCADDTAAQLQAIGVRALSRDASAKPQPVLTELPVHCDWTRQCRQAREAGTSLISNVTVDMLRYLNTQPTIGLMLHHAVMDEEELGLLQHLLTAWTAHPNARWVQMRALLPGATA